MTYSQWVSLWLFHLQVEGHGLPTSQPPFVASYPLLQVPVMRGRRYVRHGAWMVRGPGADHLKVDTFLLGCWVGSAGSEV